MLKIFFKETQMLSQFSPIWGNQLFPPGRADAGFKQWSSKGLKTIEELYLPNSDILMTFEQLISNYNLSKTHFFKYLQIRNFIKTSQNNEHRKPKQSSLEKMMLKNSQRKGLISEIYNLLTSSSSENSHRKHKAWSENLQLEISEEDWSLACAEAHTKSINTHNKLIHYKWLMRTYITPVELNKYDKNIPDICTKCIDAKGTFFHCIWQCRKISPFWEEVRKTTEKIISKQIPTNPKFFLLGLYPKNSKYKKT